jgi:hypothetical protein
MKPLPADMGSTGARAIRILGAAILHNGFHVRR